MDNSDEPEDLLDGKIVFQKNKDRTFSKTKNWNQPGVARSTRCSALRDMAKINGPVAGSVTGTQVHFDSDASRVEEKPPHRSLVAQTSSDFQADDSSSLSSVETSDDQGMRGVHSHAVAEPEENDPEQVNTQEVFKLFHNILNKLTPKSFEQLADQVTELDINTEERLKGVIELTFEKAISEPSFSVVYARMCHSLMGVTGENYYSVDCEQITQRATLLQKYLQDEETQLQALCALEALIGQMDQLDQDVIEPTEFYKWVRVKRRPHRAAGQRRDPQVGH
ncbi:unnamed protein product [Pleuronectes platessa]|uniref:MIF4G domain-containing protein n=1 Tax=Pleuronectes platessa TaxID=8262 RepID=A0A9N7VDD8_PLEPL|nr:unnamed protein product [Pleuronectes platessa]